MSPDDMELWLQGNLVVVAAQHDNGVDGAAAAFGFARMLAVNGIDFGALGSGRPDYDDGVYSFRNGDAVIGARFLFAEDVGDWQAGEPISHDLLSADSFIRNVSIDFEWSLDDLGPTIVFDEGPLFALIDAEIDFDGAAPTSFSISLDTSAIAVQIVTEQTYQLDAPLDQDDLTIHLDTTPVPLADLASVLQDDGIGLDYTDTSLDSRYFDLQQVFTDAVFMLRQLEDGGWGFVGPYDAVSTKGDVTLYHLGDVSTFDGSSVSFFCDAARTQYVGTAVHDQDLAGGTFTTSDGRRFDYSLDEIPNWDERSN
jgi:hypothetical protein